MYPSSVDGRRPSSAGMIGVGDESSIPRDDDGDDFDFGDVVVVGGGGMTDPLLDPHPPSSSSSSSSPPTTATTATTTTATDHRPPTPRPLPLLLLDDYDSTSTSSSSSSSRIRRNFHRMSVLFAINHGCSVSVLGLANARLGSVGVWSSGMLYASYTLSALFGTTMVVSRLGCRRGLMLGMGMVAVYVTSFFVVASSTGTTTIVTEGGEGEVENGGGGVRYVVAMTGAIVGGIGSSILWVSQGAYFATASRLYASATTTAATTTTAGEVRRRRGGRRRRRRGGGGGEDGDRTLDAPPASSEDATSEFGATFAFVFLLLEVMLRSLSTFLIRTAGMSWRVVFGSYALLSVLPACLMTGVADPEQLRTEDDDDDDYDYDEDEDDEDDGGGGGEEVDDRRPPLKATAALDLLRTDPKTKYLSPICVLFGMSTSFASSILNGEVIQRVLSDPNSTYVGLYTAVTSLVAAGSSLIFGWMQTSRGRFRCGKGDALTIGASSYLTISLLFLFLLDWDRMTLLFIYTLLGIGRATYEGTLRAVFADFFPNDKEGAFGNVILFTGTSSTVGYVLSVTGALECDRVGRYCLEYSDGSMHNVLVMEWVIIVTAIVAIPSFWRAAWLFRNDRR